MDLGPRTTSLLPLASDWPTVPRHASSCLLAIAAAVASEAAALAQYFAASRDAVAEPFLAMTFAVRFSGGTTSLRQRRSWRSSILRHVLSWSSATPLQSLRLIESARFLESLAACFEPDASDLLNCLPHWL